jgi:hypothetical protein
MNQIEIYQTKDNQTEIQVRLENETVWLSQKQMALLFDCSTDNISLHLKNIFKTKELNPDSVTEEFSVTATDGKKYKTKHYDLDTIISLGYRINSQRATQFRQWATQRLKDYFSSLPSLTIVNFPATVSPQWPVRWWADVAAF